MKKSLIAIIFSIIILTNLSVYSSGWWPTTRVTYEEQKSDFQPICEFDGFGIPHIVFRTGVVINGASEIYYGKFNYLNNRWLFYNKNLSASGAFSWGPDIALLELDVQNNKEVIPLICWARAIATDKSIIEYTYFDGTNFTSPIVVENPGYNMNSDPEMIVNKLDNSLILIWTSSVKKDTQNDLFYAVSHDYRKGFTNVRKLDFSDAVKSDISPSLSQDRSGNLWLAWRVLSLNEPVITSEIKVAKLDKNTGQWTVFNPLDESSEEPYISTYQFSDSVLAVWRKNEGQNKNIYSSFFNQTEGKWEPLGMVNPPDMTMNFYPACDFIFGQLMACCWTSISKNIEQYIWFNYYDNNKKSWNTEALNISERAGFRDLEPDVSADGLGNFICVWQGEVVKDKNIIYDIFTRLFDCEPLHVVMIKPYNGQTDVNTNTVIDVYFLEPLDENTLTKNNINIHGDDSGDHDWDVNIHPDENNELLVLTFKPKKGFSPGEKVTITIKNLKDRYDNVMIEEFKSSFLVGSESGFIDDNVYLWPNPVSNNTVSMRMNLYQPAEITFDIYDLSGRKVATYSSYKEPGLGIDETINVSNLGSDVYIFIMKVKSELSGEQKQFTKKLAVVR
ncbi:MAG: Ig-like domain-containing protein [bacterium]